LFWSDFYYKPSKLFTDGIHKKRRSKSLNGTEEKGGGSYPVETFVREVYIGATLHLEPSLK